MKPYQDRVWLWEQYWTRRLSTPEISKQFGFGASTIQTWLVKLAIPVRSAGEGQRGKKKRPYTSAEKRVISERMMAYRARSREPRPYHDREWLYQKYAVDKLSCYQIGRLCGDDNRKVWRWLKKFGLPRRNKSEAIKEHYAQHPEAALKGAKNSQYGLKRSEEYKQHRREKCRANWQDPAYVAKTLSACAVKPTKPERLLAEMLPPNVRYVGNHAWWKTLRDGRHKNPDFKVSGENKIIEVWGKHWHEDEDPQALIDSYKQSNLDCLVIWDHEIYRQPELVKERVAQFLSA